MVWMALAVAAVVVGWVFIWCLCRAAADADLAAHTYARRSLEGDRRAAGDSSHQYLRGAGDAESLSGDSEERIDGYHFNFFV